MVIVLVPARITHVKVYGEASGAISATVIENARGPVLCTWSSTGTALPVHDDPGPKSHLIAGKYRLLVQDEHEEEASITYKVTQNRPLIIYPGNISHVDIFGQSTGTIGRSTVGGGSGSYTPYWSSDVVDLSEDHSLQAKQNLPAGSYTLRVIDGIGAEDQHVFQVRQSTQLSIRPGAVKNATLNGLYGGYIGSSHILGGVKPYSLVWTKSLGHHDYVIEAPVSAPDAAVLTTRRELLPGTYTLTVTDSLSASATAVFKVREGPNKQYFEFAGTRNFLRIGD